MTGFLSRCGLMLAASMLAQTPLSAQTVITYTGTVTSGTDTAGIFGAPQSSLAGASFTAVYSLIDSLPGARGSTISGYYDGGTSVGFASPQSAVLTINGISIPFSGNFYSDAFQQNGNTTLGDQTYHEADQRTTASGIESTNVLYTSMFSNVHNIVGSNVMTVPIDYTAQPGDAPFGYVEFVNRNTGTSVRQYQLVANLLPSRVIIRGTPQTSAVPEPATWAMMLIGFGAIGTRIRRRSRSRTPELA